MRRKSCQYCGRAFDLRSYAHHADTCLDNPAYRWKLHQEIPPDISAHEYNRLAKFHDWPLRSRYERKFGSFHKFMEWVATASVARTETRIHPGGGGGDGLAVLKSYTDARGCTHYILR